MGNNLELGNRGEDWATNWLLNQGYEIHVRNYRYGKAEIDIIARKEKLLVFVEVKTRTNLAFGDPEMAVNQQKIGHIKKAAEQFILSSDWQGDIRFDVIAIAITGNQEPSIQHIEDAFY